MVVIVTSILLAFALDAWWSEYRQAREASDLRAALIAEFEVAGEELAVSVSRNERIIASADTLLRMLSGGTSPVVVAAGTVGALILTPTTDPQRGTLDALIASGRLDLLGSPALRGLLADWPAELDDVREEELAAKAFVHEHLALFLGRVTDLAPVYDWRIAERQSVEPGRLRQAGTVAVRDMSIRLDSDPELTNMIETRRYLARMVLTNFTTLTAAFDRIRAELAK